MANVSVFDMQGKEVGKMDLSDSVFGAKVNEHLLHLAVVAQLANKRQGTQKALTRSEVSGGGRKPWKQKGTGHARQGSIRAPQWRGGGVVFAPVPRDYTTTMNKKEKRAALKAALTNAVQENKLIVIDDIKFDEIKTKNFQAMLDAFKLEKAFVLLDSNDKNTVLSARNIPDVKTAQVNELNVYDVLKYQTVVASKEAIQKIEEVYA
jgi:large subunit ribosomal protein L4